MMWIYGYLLIGRVTGAIYGVKNLLERPSFEAREVLRVMDLRIPVMLTNQSSNVTSASSCIDQLMSISDITSFLSAIHQCALKRFLISKLLGVDVQITQQECRIGLLPALPYKFRVIL